MATDCGMYTKQDDRHFQELCAQMPMAKNAFVDYADSGIEGEVKAFTAVVSKFTHAKEGVKTKWAKRAIDELQGLLNSIAEDDANAAYRKQLMEQMPVVELLAKNDGGSLVDMVKERGPQALGMLSKMYTAAKVLKTCATLGKGKKQPCMLLISAASEAFQAYMLHREAKEEHRQVMELGEKVEELREVIEELPGMKKKCEELLGEIELVINMLFGAVDTHISSMDLVSLISRWQTKKKECRLQLNAYSDKIRFCQTQINYILDNSMKLQESSEARETNAKIGAFGAIVTLIAAGAAGGAMQGMKKSGFSLTGAMMTTSAMASAKAAWDYVSTVKLCQESIVLCKQHIENCKGFQVIIDEHKKHLSNFEKHYEHLNKNELMDLVDELRKADAFHQHFEKYTKLLCDALEDVDEEDSDDDTLESTYKKIRKRMKKAIKNDQMREKDKGKVEAHITVFQQDYKKYGLEKMKKIYINSHES